MTLHDIFSGIFILSLFTPCLVWVCVELNRGKGLDQMFADIAAVMHRLMQGKQIEPAYEPPPHIPLLGYEIDHLVEDYIRANDQPLERHTREQQELVNWQLTFERKTNGKST